VPAPHFADWLGERRTDTAGTRLVVPPPRVPAPSTGVDGDGDSGLGEIDMGVPARLPRPMAAPRPAARSVRTTTSTVPPPAAAAAPTVATATATTATERTGASVPVPAAATAVGLGTGTETEAYRLALRLSEEKNELLASKYRSLKRKMLRQSLRASSVGPADPGLLSAAAAATGAVSGPMPCLVGLGRGASTDGVACRRSLGAHRRGLHS
jgi:hypothetical protein